MILFDTWMHILEFALIALMVMGAFSVYGIMGRKDGSSESDAGTVPSGNVKPVKEFEAVLAKLTG